MRKGLDRKAVVESAMQLIDKNGFEAFSMTALAGAMGIKTASLYNHIDNIGDLLGEVSMRAAVMMNGAAEEAMKGKRRKDALHALAFSLWDYARKHPGLYHLSVRGTMDGNYSEVKAETMRVLDPISEAICQYELTCEQKVHWHRIIRSVGYGFILHETSNAFSLKEYNTADTFCIVVDELHNALCALEAENKSNNTEGSL